MTLLLDRIIEEAELEEELEEEERESEVDRSSREYVRWVQRSLNKILGTNLGVDGISGSKTRSAIRTFQRRFGLTVDGRVGPKTENVLTMLSLTPPPTASAPLPPTPSARRRVIRIWVFSMGTPSSSSRDLFLQRVEWLNLTDVALFVNGLNDREFSFSSTRASRIEETARRLNDLNVATHLVSWLRPSKSYMSKCADILRPFCQRISARSLLFDVEEPWTRNVGGEAGARELLHQYWPFRDWPCDLGATGITFVPGAVKPVAELCDYSLPQAYSVANSRGEYRTYVASDGKERTIYRPGTTQREAHKRWRGWLSYSHKRMVMGLAAWHLNRPGGISLTEAMQRSIEATENLRDPVVPEVAYWSLEWITKSKEIAAFIRSAGEKVKRGVAQSPQQQFEMAGLSRYGIERL